MQDILNARGSGAILLGILLVIVVLISLFKKNDDNEENEEVRNCHPLNLNDEDAVVASLIASIECRNETHKNVQILSVREIK